MEVSSSTARALREAMHRLLTGRPERTDGRLANANLAVRVRWCPERAQVLVPLARTCLCAATSLGRGHTYAATTGVYTGVSDEYRNGFGTWPPIVRYLGTRFSVLGTF